MNKSVLRNWNENHEKKIDKILHRAHQRVWSWNGATLIHIYVTIWHNKYMIHRRQLYRLTKIIEFEIATPLSFIHSINKTKQFTIKRDGLEFKHSKCMSNIKIKQWFNIKSNSMILFLFFLCVVVVYFTREPYHGCIFNIIIKIKRKKNEKREIKYREL